MGWYYRLSLKAKLYVSFCMIIVLTLIISILSLSSMGKSQDVAEYAHQSLQNRFVKLENAMGYAIDTQTDILEFINLYKNNKQTLDDADKSVNTMFALVNDLPTDRFPKRLGASKKIATFIKDTYFNRIKPAVMAGKVGDAVQINVHELAPQFKELFSYLRDVRGLQLKNLLDQTNSLADNEERVIISVVTIAVLVLSFLVASLTGNYCKRAIDNVIQNIKLLEHQDYSQQFSVKHQDEFGQLAQSLENLRMQQRSVLEHIKDAVNVVTNNMHNVDRDMQVLATNAGETESRTITVAAATNEMVSTTKEIARNCENAAELARQSNRITNDGIDQAKESISSIYNQSEQTKKDSEQINAMISQSRNISSIVGTIDEIAGQTNLLALNAAIEAARAGEAGRGFAVVADEVRALAMRTTNSTNEITQMVNLIEKDAEVATVSLERSVNDIDDIAHNTANLETVLNDILQHVTEVNMQITHIAAAIEQQTTSSSEISSHIQEITQSMQEVNKIASDTKQVISDTVQSANNLSVEVNRFKI